MGQRRTWPPVVMHLSGRELRDGFEPAEAHVVLWYATADPYAVTVTIVANNHDPVICVFARDLLINGIEWPIGTGDITVEPGGDDVVRMILRGERHQAVVEVRHDDVTAFLRDSYVLVPPSCESAHLDLDRLVAQLLES